MHLRPAPLLFLAMLTACASPPVSEQDPAPDTCGLGQHHHITGLGYESLLKVEILGPVRVIRPGDAVTLDWLPTRLNIALDDRDRVQRLYCG